jgi:O-acetyl-ADP-ribose deacetylase (regulator of RNase III)
MIHYLNQDVTTARQQIIVHQVNCQGRMGSGVAKAIKEKFPNVYTEYKKYCDKYGRPAVINVLLGKCQIVEIDEPNRNRPDKQYVANLFAQDKYGFDGQMYTSYDAFLKGLQTLKEFCIEHNITSIAFPEKIGCGRGGADWQIISRMIETTFEDLLFRKDNQLKLYYYFLNEEKDENGLYNSGTSLFAE